MDFATGKICVADNTSYITTGPLTSTYREGNATIQLEITPANATYNTGTDEPDAVPTWAAGAGRNVVAAKKQEKKGHWKRASLGRPSFGRSGKRPA
jgi:hypothetical protein